MSVINTTDVHENLQMQLKQEIENSDYLPEENCSYVLRIVVMYFILFIGKRLVSTILKKFSILKNKPRVRKKYKNSFLLFI
jgi:hypothetical protein